MISEKKHYILLLDKSSSNLKAPKGKPEKQKRKGGAGGSGWGLTCESAISLMVLSFPTAYILLLSGEEVTPITQNNWGSLQLYHPPPPF